MPIKTNIPHGIVFIMDMAHDDAASPEYIHGEVIASNGACVSVATTHEIDGETELELSDVLDSRWVDRVVRVFSGSVETPSGNLSIVTSNNEALLTLKTGDVRTSFQVFVDTVDSPELVVVVAGVAA